MCWNLVPLFQQFVFGKFLKSFKQMNDKQICQMLRYLFIKYGLNHWKQMVYY
jgi:hypothetical protein